MQVSFGFFLPYLLKLKRFEIEILCWLLNFILQKWGCFVVRFFNYLSSNTNSASSDSL